MREPRGGLHIGPAFICVYMDNDSRICSTSPMSLPDGYQMRFIERGGLAVAAHLRAEAVSPTLTRFIGSLTYNRPAVVDSVELWRGSECLNAQKLDRTVHVSVGAELIINIDLQHLPGQVDLWAEAAQVPPKFTTVEEAQAWLDARA